MSGDEELDKLLFSIPKSSKKKKDSTENPPPTEPEQTVEKKVDSAHESGVDPLDVVELKDQQRKIVTWLSRHPKASLQDLQEALAIPEADLEILLAELVKENRIQSAEQDGKMTYSAPIHGRASRRLRGFPEDLWKKAGLDDK